MNDIFTKSPKTLGVAEICYYSKQVMNEDGHTSNIRDKILTINVKRGWRAGTKITFPKEGDQGPNNIPGITQL